MLLPPALARFVEWFAAHQATLGDTLRSIIAAPTEDHALPLPSSSMTGAIAQRLALDGSGRIELQWAQWLDDVGRPELVAVAEHVRQSHARLEPEGALDHALKSVSAAIDELPETVELAGARTFASEGRVVVEVPLAPYLRLAFVTEFELALARARESAADALGDTARRVEVVEKVLEYYSLSVQRHAVEVEDPEQIEGLARTGHDRVRALLDELAARRLAAAQRVVAELVEHTAAALEDACAPYRAHDADALRRRLDTLERARRSGPPAPAMHERARTLVHAAYRTARPFGRRLVVELRALLAEREPDVARRAYERLVGIEASELGRDLPPGYRDLFSAGSIEFSDTYVPREAPAAALESAIAAWRGGATQSVLLHGDRGSGKRTLLNQVLARTIGRARTRWVRLGPKLRDEAVVARVLARRLDVRLDAPRFAALARALDGCEARRVIVIENAERMLSPSADGIVRMSALLRLVGETASSTLWILVMATPAADLALHRLDLAHRIPTIVGVDAMRAAEIRTLVMARHRLSGFGLEFAPPDLRLIDHVRDPIGSLRSARRPSAAFFDRLWRLSGGNPRQALYSWLSSARLHSRREGCILLGRPPPTTELISGMGLSQRLILALLAQYGSLSDADLRSILSATLEGTEGDLQVLCARGLVAPSREHARHFTLQSTAAHPLVLELRAANMI